MLDVAAGTGNAAIRAAERGAEVTASDLTPELLAAGRASTDAELEWVEADAERLPFADESFDVVMSSIGAMFAPHHQAGADELIVVSAIHDHEARVRSFEIVAEVAGQIGTAEPVGTSP